MKLFVLVLIEKEKANPLAVRFYLIELSVT